MKRAVVIIGVLILISFSGVALVGAEEEITSSTPPIWVENVKTWQLTAIGLQPDGNGVFTHLLFRKDGAEKEKNSAILTYQLMPEVGSPMIKVGKLTMALWLDAEGDRHRWINAELDQTPPSRESVEIPLSKF